MQNSPQDVHKKVLGRWGENLTVKYLKKQGYKILERNFTAPFGEVDIIAYKDGTYAFVEVKARERDAFGLPSEAVNREKQRKYKMLANYYCQIKGEELPIRFDVASILDGDLEYFENAFT